MATLLTWIKTARPRFVVYLVGPYLLGYIAGGQLTDQLSLEFLFGLLYFLLPANLLLYGINDLSDQDTDEFNPKKGSQEILASGKVRTQIRRGVDLSVLVSLVYIVFQADQRISLLLLLFLALSFAYSMQPLRLKRWPLLDMISNSLYLIPGLVGYLMTAGAWPNVLVILAGVLWVMAMQLYSAIPDISADRKADLATTAVVLGEKRSLWMVAVLWLGFAGLMMVSTNLLSLVFLIYPLLPLLVLFKLIDVRKLYWLFPIITGVIGLSWYWYLALT